MADPKKLTAEFLLKSFFDAKGTKEAAAALAALDKANKKTAEGQKGAGKAATDLEKRLEALIVDIDKAGTFAGDISAERLAKMKIEMREVAKAADDAGEELQDLSKAARGLDRVKTKFKEVQVEGSKFNKEIEQDRKAAERFTLINQQVTKDLGGLQLALGPAIATAAASFGAGMLIIKKAGVDTGPTLELLNEGATAAAKGINAFVVEVLQLEEIGQAIGGADADIKEFGGSIERLNRALAEFQDSARDTTAILTDIESAAKSLGVVTETQATNAMFDFAEQLNQLVTPAALSKSEIDKLIVTFRGLRDQGAESSPTIDGLIRRFGLLGETAAETSTRLKKETVDLSKTRAETVKAAKGIFDLGDAIVKQDAAAIESSRDRFNKETQLQEEQMVRLAQIAVRRVRIELGIGDATDQRILNLEEALRRELELRQISAEERIELERLLQAEIDKIRGAASEKGDQERERNLEKENQAINEILSAQAEAAGIEAEVAANLSQFLQNLNTAQTNWANLNARQRTETVLGATSAALGAARGAFGESKELALSEAAINTALGATKALGQGGILGPALAAIVIAFGLLQIAEIQKAGEGTSATQAIRQRSSSGSTAGSSSSAPSFDDPINDAAARFAGAQSARDVAGHFGSGFRSTLLSGLAHTQPGNTSPSAISGPVTNFTQNVNGGGFMPARDVSRKLSRGLRAFNGRIEKRVTKTRKRVRS